MECPKCRFEQPAGDTTCWRCGVVFSKYKPGSKHQSHAVKTEVFASEEDQQQPELAADLQSFQEQGLAKARSLQVQQNRERLEFWTGFEAKNQYIIRDQMHHNLFIAAEESGWGNFLVRNFLGPLRPFRIEVRDFNESLFLQIVRPFRFFFFEIEIQDSQGYVLGTVQRSFTLLQRNFLVKNAQGGLIYQIVGPIFRPWTFRILKGTDEIALIEKKWSGFAKEALTKADNFKVTFQQDIDIIHKKILLGAVFLIDFVYFEKSN